MRRISLALFGAVMVAAALFPAVSDAQTRDGSALAGFESGVSGFYAQGVSPGDPGPSTATQTAVNPLEGSYSLRLDSRSSGQNFWWIHPYSGAANWFVVSARMRSDVSSSSELRFCAMAYYGAAFAENCTTVTGDAGDKGVVSAVATLDSTQPLTSIGIRMSQDGTENPLFTLDRASACLNPVPLPIVTPIPPRVVR